MNIYKKHWWISQERFTQMLVVSNSKRENYFELSVIWDRKLVSHDQHEFQVTQTLRYPHIQSDNNIIETNVGILDVVSN